jgi:threonine aldolase
VADIVRLRKTSMQLASKMRFFSAQLLALFEGVGLSAAAHANQMATRLRDALEAGIADGSITGLTFSQATQANAVFVVLAIVAAYRIRARFRFYDWDRAAGQVRWMTAFDTTEADVDAFVAAIREELAR